MNITQDVITDLLPAYVSGEASADTHAVVDEFLSTNPEFAAIVQAARREHGAPFLADQGAIAPDLEREAVTRTRAVIRRQRRALAFAVLLTVLPLSFSFGPSGIRFILRDEPLWALLWIPAGCLWFAYLRLQSRLTAARL